MFLSDFFLESNISTQPNTSPGPLENAYEQHHQTYGTRINGECTYLKSNERAHFNDKKMTSHVARYAYAAEKLSADVEQINLNTCQRKKNYNIRYAEKCDN